MGPLSPEEAQNSWKAIPLTSPEGGLACGQIPVRPVTVLPTHLHPKRPGREVASQPRAQAQIHHTLAPIPVLLLRCRVTWGPHFLIF